MPLWFSGCYWLSLCLAGRVRFGTVIANSTRWQVLTESAMFGGVFDH